MKVTIIKKKGKNETITRHPVEDIALFIQKGWRQHTVTELREMYNLILKERQPDGQILTNWAGGIKLERLCFAQEFDKFKGEHRVLGYNGLIVIEVNNLPTYEKAVEVTGQTLNSYYKSHIVNITDTILSWQLQCKHLVYIILY